MSAKASIPHGALAENLLATVDASADPTRPPIHPDTLALYDLWLASGAANEPAASPPPPASDDDEEEDYDDDDADNEPLPAPADQTATASDAPPLPPPAPMSDEKKDDDSVPEVPGTTI